MVLHRRNVQFKADVLDKKENVSMSVNTQVSKLTSALSVVIQRPLLTVPSEVIVIAVQSTRLASCLTSKALKLAVTLFVFWITRALFASLKSTRLPYPKITNPFTR